MVKFTENRKVVFGEVDREHLKKTIPVWEMRMSAVSLTEYLPIMMVLWLTSKMHGFQKLGHKCPIFFLLHSNKAQLLTHLL